MCLTQFGQKNRLSEFFWGKKNSSIARLHSKQQLTRLFYLQGRSCERVLLIKKMSCEAQYNIRTYIYIHQVFDKPFPKAQGAYRSGKTIYMHIKIETSWRIIKLESWKEMCFLESIWPQVTL